MHRASGEDLFFNFVRLRSAHSELRRGGAPQNKTKSSAPKTQKPNQKLKEVKEHYVGPQPTGTQTRNQTKPTDRPTEPSTGPGPGADTKLHHEILTCD